jgi:hypothetical protein
MSRLRLATIRFLFWSLAIQVLVITIGGNILPDLFAAFDATTLIALMLVSEGLIAGGAAAAFWMPRSWQALNALLPCAIYLASVQVGPAWLYFVALLLLLIFFGPTLFNRVPYYPTAKAGYEAIDALVAKQQPTHFIDLGCGFGGMLFYLAPRYPHINFIGVESAIVPFYITRLLAALRRSPTPQIIWGKYLETRSSGLRDGVHLPLTSPNGRALGKGQK